MALGALGGFSASIWVFCNETNRYLHRLQTAKFGASSLFFYDLQSTVWSHVRGLRPDSVALPKSWNARNLIWLVIFLLT